MITVNSVCLQTGSHYERSIPPWGPASVWCAAMYHGLESASTVIWRSMRGQVWDTTAALSVNSRRWASTSPWSMWRVMWKLGNPNLQRQGKTNAGMWRAVGLFCHDNWLSLLSSCWPVCIVWQGLGPLSSPPTGAVLTAAALPDLRPAFSSTFLHQQTVTRQSTCVGCVSSPAPDCQLLGDISRLIYRACQTATHLA